MDVKMIDPLLKLVMSALVEVQLLKILEHSEHRDYIKTMQQFRLSEFLIEAMD